MSLPDVVSGLLLSVGSGVQVPFATPANNAESLCFQGFSAFLSNPVVITEIELWFRISLSNSDF